MAARQTVNLLRGSVIWEVTGSGPEHFLNLCAREGVPFWGLERVDGHTLRLRTGWRHRRALAALAEQAGCQARAMGERGVPPFLLRFRRRYAFLAGLALALLAASLLSRFVLVVDVQGNGRVPTAVILTALERAGLRPGSYGPTLEEREVANGALLELPELSWMTVNLHGIQAQVIVRERAARPELEDRSTLGDMVAKAPGIVTHLEVQNGEAAVEKGATVLPGDVLIRGELELPAPPYNPERGPSYFPVRAAGRVEGRTWRTLSAAVPLAGEGKTATGDEKTRWSLTFLGQRVNFYQNSGIPFAKYDKITDTWQPHLPGGTALPLTLRREVCRAYETTRWDWEPAEAQAVLEQVLLSRLEALLGEEGELVSRHFSARERDGMLTVVLTAECREELGRFVPAG